ncbi:MAG: extracellular solute-binding protein [Pseudobutyrivibrio sp.]|nr:extracellular solute-binding protein [Pseudobutyrivibrio sp.]
MKRIGKLTAAALSTVMAASVVMTGCGSASTNSEGSGAAGGEEAAAAKITIFQSKTEIMDDLNALAEAYTEETGTEVEVWETTGDNYLSDLKTDLSTEKGPTLFSLQPGAESIQMADYLEDLGDLDFVDKVSAGLADEVDGKTVGIPYTVEGFGLVYNKDLVDAEGFTSTDDLVSYLSSAADVNALGLSQEDYFLIAHIFNAPFAVQENPDEYLAQVLSGEVRLADNDAFKEFAQIMEAIRANCTNPADITYDGNCGDFATGKTAMIHQGNWAWSMFADYDMSFETGLAAVPIQGNDKLSVSVPICWYLNTDASDEEKASAKQFLNWLYTSDTGKDYLMNKFGFIPVIDGMTSDGIDPLSQSVADAVAADKIIPWVMSNWPAGIVSTDLAPITLDFFTSDMTGEELLNQLNDAFVNAQ